MGSRGVIFGTTHTTEPGSARRVIRLAWRQHDGSDPLNCSELSTEHQAVEDRPGHRWRLWPLGFLGFRPPLECLPDGVQDKLVATLPLNYDIATIRTIENIDVIWLERRAIAHAFEIEHTTAVYSGLLRMADLLAMQPRINISLHIVAPSSRRDRVRREIVRPVFSILEGGAMYERCSFLAYESIDEILEQPNLSYMRETILEAYEEYFDA